MNNSTKLAIYSQLAAVSAAVAKLSEDLGTDSSDATVRYGAQQVHDLSAALYDLVASVTSPPGAYSFQSPGDFVVIEEVASGSERDKANQRLAEGFRRLEEKGAA